MNMQTLLERNIDSALPEFVQYVEEYKRGEV